MRKEIIGELNFGLAKTFDKKNFVFIKVLLTISFTFDGYLRCAKFAQCYLKDKRRRDHFCPAANGKQTI